MKDGRFPSSLWGELLLTAVYLCNRSPHSALGGATPFSKLYGKDADMTALRVIGARAFVHHERYTKKLDDRAFEVNSVASARTVRHTGSTFRQAATSLNTGTLHSSRHQPAHTIPADISLDDYNYEGDLSLIHI